MLSFELEDVINMSLKSRDIGQYDYIIIYLLPDLGL